jgi:hypothetical protein
MIAAVICSVSLEFTESVEGKIRRGKKITFVLKLVF